MWQPSKPLPMSEAQKKTLETWVQASTTAQRIVLRSRICLLAAEGKSNNAIAGQLEVTRPTVLLWRKRFAQQGPPGLAEDAPHGRSSRRTQDKVTKAIVEATLHTTPPDATHWSTRTMATKFGVSNAAICRI
jgi:transposase